MAMAGTIESITETTFPLVANGIVAEQERGIVSQSLAETAIRTAANLVLLRGERETRDAEFARRNALIEARYQAHIAQLETTQTPTVRRPS